MSMIRFALAGATALAIGICSTFASAQEVTLRAVAVLPKTNPLLAQVLVWVEDVNTAMKGKLQINYVGGPEVIPRPQLTEAVRNGIVDIGISFAADYQDQVPTTPAYTLSRLSPSEERKSGFFDMMVGEHKKINVMPLGRVQMSPFYLFVKKEPKTIADLKGMKMRSAPLYERFLRELGMVPVTINAPETYNALEGGIVDGLAWGTVGVRAQGWAKHVKYVVDLPFFEWSNGVALMNLDKWNALPEATRKQLMDITIAFEPKMVAAFRGAIDQEWAELAKEGVKRVKFSDAENKKFIDTAYDVEWKSLAQKLPAETVEKLRKTTGN